MPNSKLNHHVMLLNLVEFQTLLIRKMAPTSVTIAIQSTSLIKTFLWFTGIIFADDKCMVIEKWLKEMRRVEVHFFDTEFCTLSDDCLCIRPAWTILGLRIWEKISSTSSCRVLISRSVCQLLTFSWSASFLIAFCVSYQGFH